jgi:hypothetical protein
VATHLPVASPQTLVRRRAYVFKEKTPLQPRKPSQVHDDDEIYDDPLPSPKRARMVEPAVEHEENGTADNWRRRSKRQREPVVSAPDMVMWDEIDQDDYDIGSDISASE